MLNVRLLFKKTNNMTKSYLDKNEKKNRMLWNSINIANKAEFDFFNSVV